MLSFIKFERVHAEDSFEVIVPTEVKDILIEIFTTLYMDLKPKIIINNIVEKDIELDNTKDNLEMALEYLTLGIDDYDFLDIREANIIKNNLKIIGKLCNIKYINWDYNNLMEE